MRADSTRGAEIHFFRKQLCYPFAGEGGTSPLQNVIRITQSVGTALAPVRQKIPRCKAKFLHLSTQKRPGLKPERFFLKYE